MTDEDKFDVYQTTHSHVQTAIAGVDVTIAVQVLLNSISQLIAIGAKDQIMAFSMIDTLPQLMKRAVVAEWERAREIRANSVAHTPSTGGGVH